MTGVRVELDVPARMRDGVVLRANVYRPDATGRWPTLLARTPYGKDDHSQAVWCGLDPVQTARRGFVVAIQDVRGRFASDGDWEPLRAERDDGYDAVQWAAALPGSDGRVGMFSASYCAAAQWLAASGRPPALAAVAPSMCWSDPLDGLYARGGAVELGVALRWALENGSGPRDDWDLYWHLPVHEILAHHGQPDLGGLRALNDPEVAPRADLRGLADIPAFHTTGWYDSLLQGTLDHFAAAGGRLVVGPWTHHAFADPVGEMAFGAHAGRTASGWADAQLAWLGGEPDDGPPVRIFVMGRNGWRDEPSWPPARAVPQRWFLHADGRLDRSGPAAAESARAFAYDPGEPVPTVGGHGVLSPDRPSGPFDQRPIEARDDVLVYTSAPLEAELEITGRVRVVLQAESSAPSTDWVARLCDVHPDGRSINLCDGIVRVAAGGRHEIDLWSTSNVFLAGHRLRVQVTSSSFPRWDRNLNTGDQRAPLHAVAGQRIGHPSFIELPVIA